MKPLAVPLAALALAAALAGRGYAQTVPPRATPVPWQPRPVIIIDPRPYLATPRPAPHASAKRHATPHPRATPPLRRTPRAAQTPETFERIDTSPPPARPPR